MADALGLADEDALLRAVSLAGRRLAFVADETWRRVDAALVRRPRGRCRRVRREPLAEGIVRQGDEVVLARDARPAADPGAAAARGRRGRPRRPAAVALHAQGAGRALARRCPSRGRRRSAGRSCGCWPAGRSAVAVLEQLDQEGLLSRLLPEWDRVRVAAAAPPVAPVHRRPAPGRGRRGRRRAHPRRRPARPAAGRRAAARHRQGLAGRPQRGRRADRPPRSPTRMGFAAGRRRRDRRLVRHHLLLPDTATRRDIDDPATTERVADTIGGDPAVLQLLHALAQADGAATSSSAWSPWKAHLVAALVARVQAQLGPAHGGRAGPGAAPRPQPQVTSGPASRAGRGDASGWRTSPTASRSPSAPPTGPGCSAAAPACWRSTSSTCGRRRSRSRATAAITVFAVRPRFGRAPVPEILADGVRAALDGTLPLAERLRQREVDYRQDGAPDRPAADLLARRRGQRRGHRHRRGPRRRPRRAAVPAHRRPGRRGPRRHRRPGWRPSAPTRPTPSTCATRRAGRSTPASGTRVERGARRGDRRDACPEPRAHGDAPGASATRRAEVPGSVGGPCDRAGAGPGRTVRRARGSPRGHPHGPLPDLRRLPGVRAAALRRRAHRRRRRVPRVGLRRLRHRRCCPARSRP